MRIIFLTTATKENVSSRVIYILGKRKKHKKTGKLKLKIGKSQRNTNLSAKQGKKQANKAPLTDASISDYNPDEVKGDPSNVQDIKGT